MSMSNNQTTFVALVIAYFIFRLLLAWIESHGERAIFLKAQAMAWDLYRDHMREEHAGGDGKQSTYYGPG